MKRGYRIYNSTHNLDGSRSIISWMQRRCIRCQRFLTKQQQQFCSKCSSIERRKERETWRINNPEKYKEYRRNYYYRSQNIRNNK